MSTTTTSSRRRSRASRAADQTAGQAISPAAGQAVTPADREAAIAAALAAAGVSDDDVAKMIKAVQPKAPKFSARRHVARELLRVAGDLAESWDPAAHEGISREDATKIIGQRLSYGPVGIWDDRLGERSDAGRRPKQDNGEDNGETADES
jgi:hypothetical protein